MSASANRPVGFLTASVLALGFALTAPPLSAEPVSAATHARLERGLPTWVVVEFEVAATDSLAQQERLRRHLVHDDAAILAQRAAGYRGVKRAVAAAAGGADVQAVLDFQHLPAAAWQLSSPAALQRLRGTPGVRAVHENAALHAVSVSDLAFIRAPAAAALGATGAGTTIAVVDGGLQSAYLASADFGGCTGVATPASCRVVLLHSTYPGASGATAHGTNVSAIALGTAPGAKLAMFDVFNGTTASVADLLNAMSLAIGYQATYNIVAINLSIGDGSSHASTCTGSAFASAVASAHNAGILTVAAAGNSGSKTGLADPACAPGVVSVGAVYDANYGTTGWVASGLAAGSCSDASGPDVVTCFSQSASYLSLLAPGTYVAAPDAALTMTGTSQATPHVSGAVAVLRASYPSESLTATLQRLQTAGLAVTDPATGRSVPRVDLLGAVQLGTALSLAGSGASTAVAGTDSSYTLTATNNGPLMGEHVTVHFQIPAGASLVAVPSGCTATGSALACSTSSLGVGANYSVTFKLHWNTSGAIYAVASVSADEINSAPPGQQLLAFGSAPAPADADAPLPLWTWVALALGLGALARRTRQVPLQKGQQVGIRLP